MCFSFMHLYMDEGLCLNTDTLEVSMVCMYQYIDLLIVKLTMHHYFADILHHLSRGFFMADVQWFQNDYYTPCQHSRV